MARFNEMDKMNFSTNKLVARQALMYILYLEGIHKFLLEKVKRVHRWRLSFKKHWNHPPPLCWNVITNFFNKLMKENGAIKVFELVFRLAPKVLSEPRILKSQYTCKI